MFCVLGVRCWIGRGGVLQERLRKTKSRCLRHVYIIYAAVYSKQGELAVHHAVAVACCLLLRVDLRCRLSHAKHRMHHRTWYDTAHNMLEPCVNVYLFATHCSLVSPKTARGIQIMGTKPPTWTSNQSTHRTKRAGTCLLYANKRSITVNISQYHSAFHITPFFVVSCIATDSQV